MMNADFLGLLVMWAGFIIGLGAVTVIDIHGFLGRKSPYWTEATIRTHKITKPLIWLGLGLSACGGVLFFRNFPLSLESYVLAGICLILILNGLFLTFKVSPFLLTRETQGMAKEVLPSSWQFRITLSFIVSFVGWWSSIIIVTNFIFQRINF